MEKDKLTKVVEAARLYYQLDYSQQEIAKRLEVSRPTVSRLLKQAKREGIVEIKIHDPSQDVHLLATDLAEAYGLLDARVAIVPEFEDQIVKKHIGKIAADYLNATIQDNDLIGVSWGTTLNEIGKNLRHQLLKNVSVVQLNGGISYSETNTYAYEVIQMIGRAFHATSHFLPVPAIVDHLLVKQTMEEDRHIRRVLDMGRNANIALYSVGIPTNDSVIVQADYVSEQELEAIHSKSVGEICSRFFDEKGMLIHEELNERTIGIDLEDLSRKEKSILAAGGPKKVEAIYGALQGGYANVLVTDHYTARALLEKKQGR
ncbi:sugar-binding transcriptional regulator [Alkalihalobacillus hwajinpoensis]|uniref:sugar-binding transcriptional regulator n=1 Tax=Guptibacillus hwajinpoensis TaxID=208199 RepID=UPI0018831F2C|nr:sugar-binding transcriptional regulator [Pseudalkalibacillus hwajinpoensis]MBF0707148.1 sugar-binding transcriptional regulator [Pseudalkalibacillus hwajinpoensis]